MPQALLSQTSLRKLLDGGTVRGSTALGLKPRRALRRKFEKLLMSTSEMATSDESVGVAFVWFRNDLRVRDHNPLSAACRCATHHVVPLYCFDSQEFSPQQNRDKRLLSIPKLGPFRLRFRLEALRCLANELAERGSRLLTFEESPSRALQRLLEEVKGATQKVGLYFHQEVGPEAEDAEKAAVCAFETTAARLGLQARVYSYFGHSLLHPTDVAPPCPQPQGRPQVVGQEDQGWAPISSNSARFSDLPTVMTDFRKAMEEKGLPVA
eukprot:jgi/Botrbrau1/4813/Bobra.0325s0032.1